MFRHIYEIGASVFVLQGALLIPLLCLASMAWVRQGARLAAVEAALGRDRARRDRTLDSLLTALPALTPLHCRACGGALALTEASTTCVGCGARSPAPADYLTTSALRRGLRRLTRAALVHWVVARLLTSAPARLLLLLLVFVEPAIFAVTLIGAATYADSWLDRLFAALGETAGVALMLAAFGGFVIWMVALLMLASLARGLRRQLPAFPAAAPRDGAATEFATCRSCGGGIAFDGRVFAALCGYCGVENYRAAYGRHERVDAEGRQVATRATLFGAMRVIEEFTGTFVVTMAILTTGFLLLVGATALRR